MSDESIDEMEDKEAGPGTDLAFTELDDPDEMDELTKAMEAEAGDEAPFLVCTGTEEETTELMIEELEARGYDVTRHEEIIEVTMEQPEPIEIKLDLPPEPSISTEDAQAIALAIVTARKERTRKLCENAVRARFNYNQGIITEKT